jgi:hypothetical protein
MPKQAQPTLENPTLCTSAITDNKFLGPVENLIDCLERAFNKGYNTHKFNIDSNKRAQLVFWDEIFLGQDNPHNPVKTQEIEDYYKKIKELDQQASKERYEANKQAAADKRAKLSMAYSQLTEAQRKTLFPKGPPQ